MPHRTQRATKALVCAGPQYKEIVEEIRLCQKESHNLILNDLHMFVSGIELLSTYINNCQLLYRNNTTVKEKIDPYLVGKIIWINKIYLFQKFKLLSHIGTGQLLDTHSLKTIPFPFTINEP
ncbi:hypothetical protein QTP88_028125 [Uroleucon formosanum]